jgi:hypothetical protein
MERETGVEPATSSLGKRLSIDNKQQGVFVGLFLAIEITQFSFWASGERLTVFKWCSRLFHGCSQQKFPDCHRRQLNVVTAAAVSLHSAGG